MSAHRRFTAAVVLALALATTRRTIAQDPTIPAPASATPHVAPAAAPDEAAAELPPSTVSTPPPVTLGGYAEAFYQWNANDPSNGLTAFRGFDNRHDTFTIANVALDVRWDYEDVIGRVTLQVGHTPSTYYLAEPTSSGGGGVNASSPELWKYVQQAYAGYRFHVAGRPLEVTAGIFLSPIGPESMAVRDDWSFSRSNLFFGLPFYHTGARASLTLPDGWTVTLAGYNGWNSVVDGNRRKSVSAQLQYTRDDLAVSVLYFGGDERPRGAPEGRTFRHLLDAHVTWHIAPRLSLLAHANGGIEPNAFGTSRWMAGALHARFRATPWLCAAARADLFREHVPANEVGRASPIFWPWRRVSSTTLTLQTSPHPRASFWLEYRHDHASESMYFRGDVEGDGAEAPFVANARTQNTITLGATAWFEATP